MNRMSATEAWDFGWIPGPVKPKTYKISIYDFPAWGLVLKRDSTYEVFTVCGG